MLFHLVISLVHAYNTYPVEFTPTVGVSKKAANNLMSFNGEMASHLNQQ